MPQDDQQELFYLVNSKDQVLGSIPRAQAHADSTKIHRAIYVLILNQNQLLLQQRSLTKDKLPGYWTISVTGHVTYGQTWEQAALREIKEEVGLTLKTQDLKLLASYIHSDNHETESCRLYSAAYSNQSLTPDPDEIQQLKWIHLKDLPEFINSHPFSPWAKLALEKSAITTHLE